MHTRARGVFFLSRKKGFFLGGSTGMSMTAGGGGGTVMGAPEMAVPEICTGGGGDPCDSAHPVVASHRSQAPWVPWQGLSFS